MPASLSLNRVETAFCEYKIIELLGEGGAGKVFAGVADDEVQVAIKFLTTSTKDKRRRFKNEINFLEKNRHKNIVSVLDYGTASVNGTVLPFYVMPRYDCNFRHIIGRTPPEETLSLFMQILEGVEAAHLQKVIHRDLKPENILFDRKRNVLAIADFGIARFAEDLLVTLVTTAPQQRLANFRYAAPEQRSGQQVDAAADVYALGLILNEAFTGETPVGTDYRTISSVAEPFGFLDEIVVAMIRQSPPSRPRSIFEIKTQVKKATEELAHRQKISAIDAAVVPENTVDDPLAINPPNIVDAKWEGGRLEITFDQNITEGWIHGLHGMGSYSSVVGADPGRFQFSKNKAYVRCSGGEAQHVVMHLKQWLPVATRTYKRLLEEQYRQQEQEALTRLRGEKAIEEERFRVNNMLRF